VLPFVEDMAAVYAAADLIVARAGAITCSELLASRTPAVLVPSPNVAGDHQTRNAEALEGTGAAVLLAEQDLTPKVLVDRVLGLLGDDAELGKMAAACMAAGAADPAADVIARTILAAIDPQ
jgi:UDP-N-acetylglucosamine--N-acetylmuramyl-(pentapeptide) pyrophosphoryl-undecaprenol N-acetylglucosamine transferase